MSVEVCRRRVGRSDGLMIVGFAFLPSSILVEWSMEIVTALSAGAKIVDDNHCGTSNRTKSLRFRVSICRCCKICSVTLDEEKMKSGVVVHKAKGQTWAK